MSGRNPSLVGRVALLLAACVLLAGCNAPTGLNLAPNPSAVPSRTPPPVASATPKVLGLAFVVRSGAEGVYMRSLPSTAPEVRTELWKDGTVLEIVGESIEAAGKRWYRVRDPKGGLGYIATEFLITATPTRTPVVTATLTPTPLPPTATATPTTPATSGPVSSSPVVPPAATATAMLSTATQVPPTALPTATTRPGPTPLPTFVPFPTSAPTATANPTATQLELVSTTESRSTAFASVEGYVRNVSNGSFENVRAVVQYFAADGTALGQGSAAIASTLLAPGLTSYFKVLVPVQPGMARFTVTFLDQSGKVIPSVDRR